MLLLYLCLSPLFMLSVVSPPPPERGTSPHDESTSREETPTQDSMRELSHAEQVAQMVTGQLPDQYGTYRFRSIDMVEAHLQWINIQDRRPSDGETGITRSQEGIYTLWVGRAELTNMRPQAHGLHQFEIGDDGLDTEALDTLFAEGIEHYAVHVAIDGLQSRGLYIKSGPGAYNIIIAHLYKIMLESDVDSDELGDVVKVRLNFGDRIQVARSLDGLIENTRFLSPRRVYDLIAYDEAQALAFSAERLARRLLRRRSVINEISTADAKSQGTNQNMAEDIEAALTYFYALRANATVALTPFIDTLMSSKNFYLENLALPLYGMVNPSAFISSPFGPGPLAPAGFDSFNDIQDGIKTSGNYSKAQLDYTASTHQYMRTAFRSVWKNATAIVNATGALQEMKNIIIYLAVTDMKYPNATDLFPESYRNVQDDPDMASIMDKTNSTPTSAS